MRKNRITLFLDEAYVDFIIPEYKSKDLDEIEDLNKHIVIVNSFSKSFGLSGWRVGYLITSADNIKKIVPYNQHLATCAPAILQYLLIENFEKLIDTCVPQAIQMTKKAIRVREYAESLGFECSKSQATFYFLLKVGDSNMDDTKFAIELLQQKNIAVVPGSSYGESTRGTVRIGVGKEDEIDILRAIDDIKIFCESF